MEISLVKYDIDYEYINKQKIFEKYNNNICNWPLVYEVKWSQILAKFTQPPDDSLT